ncbi:MAG TPA: 2-dehydropantoate 2-reductase [Dongiaceae bacterium]|nr:2-dehydropantoate 2-reductase [Dongiaceae bacterium]
MTDDTILIWGAGAIGGTVGAYLRRAGLPVLFVDRSAEHVAAMKQSGLQITGPIEEFRISAPASLPENVSGRYKLAFLCVKAHDTEGAIEVLAPFVAEDGCVVSLQNGLNEQVIARRVGEQRTIGAFVNFGADYLSPGNVTYAGHGAVVVGELDGGTTPRIREIHRLMQTFDRKAMLTPNIWGFLWSKLAYGALLFATALTNESIADCLAEAKYRPVLIALTREVVAVATAAKIKLEPFDGFDPRAFLPGSGAAAEVSLDALVAHNRRSAKSHSGIWRDLAIRKRKTEVEAQLGPISVTAEKLGMKAPLTRRTADLIHDIEDGRRPLSWDTLAELAKALPQAAAAS